MASARPRDAGDRRTVILDSPGPGGATCHSRHNSDSASTLDGSVTVSTGSQSSRPLLSTFRSCFTSTRPCRSFTLCGDRNDRTYVSSLGATPSGVGSFRHAGGSCTRRAKVRHSQRSTFGFGASVGAPSGRLGLSPVATVFVMCVRVRRRRSSPSRRRAGERQGTFVESRRQGAQRHREITGVVSGFAFVACVALLPTCPRARMVRPRPSPLAFGLLEQLSNRQLPGNDLNSGKERDHEGRLADARRPAQRQFTAPKCRSPRIV